MTTLSRQIVTYFSLATLLIGSVAPGYGESADFPLLMSRGNQALDEGRLDDAAEWFEEALKINKNSPDARNQMGLCYLRRNMLLEAAGQFRQALSIDKDFLPSLNNLGSVMYRQNHYDEAIRYYQKAIDARGNDPEILVNLASVYRDRATYNAGKSRESDFESAVNLYKTALKHSPGFAPAHNNLGLCYLRRRRYAEAEQEIQHAIQIKNDYAAAYYNLGMTYQAQHKLPEAVAAYQNSLRFETVSHYAESTRRKIKELGMPEMVSTDHFSRGFEFLSQKKWAEAADQFERAIKSKQGKTAVAWNNLGYAQAQQAKHKEACQSYATAIALLSKFPAAHYNRAQSLISLRDLDGAEQELRVAIEQAQGRYPLAHNTLAIVLKQKGDQPGALSQYKLALLQSGDTMPVVHYNLGLLYEEQGNKAGARDEFKLYLTQSPNGYNAAKARERLSVLPR